MDRFSGSVLLFCLLLLVGYSAGKRYDGFQVFTLTPTTPAHIELLKELQSQPDIEFWDANIRLGRQVEVLAPGNIVQWLSKTPNVESADFQVINEDIQASIDDGNRRMEQRHNDPSVDNYDPADYNTYEDILDHLVTLANRCPAGFNCQYEVIGQTYENRDIVVFRLTKPDAGRKSVWIDSLIHSREWLAGSTSMRVLEKLVTEYGIDADVTRFMDSFDFHVVPVHNADGYVYTWESSRFWRKSRNVNPSSSCMGTDLNRNFDIHWSDQIISLSAHGKKIYYGNEKGTIEREVCHPLADWCSKKAGTSTNPCDDAFHGASAGSEPEVQAVQEQFDAMKDDIVFVLSIHTTGNYWLAPYGNEDENGCLYPEDYSDMKQVLDVACKAIEDTYNTQWICGNVCEVLYAASGGTMDYAKVNGIKYAYAPELRGPGFNPPTSAIEPSLVETWNGIVAAIDEMATIEGFNLRR